MAEEPTLVLLDSSFILNAMKFRIFDLGEIRAAVGGQARLAIPSAVASELSHLGHWSVLEYLERSGVEKLEGAGTYADKEIVAIVKSAPGRVVVATQDGPLRAKLKTFKAKCGLIVVRGRKKIAMTSFGGVA